MARGDCGLGCDDVVVVETSGDLVSARLTVHHGGVSRCSNHHVRRQPLADIAVAGYAGTA